MTLYRITDWEKHYEYPDSKKTVGPLTWVRIQTKQDGSGFRRMASDRARSDLFSAWILMVQIAAKLPKEHRGKLVTSDGRPLDAEDLAVMTGWPADTFEKAFKFFSSTKMAWLTHEETPGMTAQKPDQNPAEPAPPATSKTVTSSGGVQKPPDTSGSSRPRSDQSRADQSTNHIAPPAGDALKLEHPPDQEGTNPKPRVRNLLFDALAKADGSDPTQITKSAASYIGKALSEIKAATPDVTPEEIETRAANYRLLWKDIRLTATGLAKHWAKCAFPPAGAEAKLRFRTDHGN